MYKTPLLRKKFWNYIGFQSTERHILRKPMAFRVHCTTGYLSIGVCARSVVLAATGGIAVILHFVSSVGVEAVTRPETKKARAPFRSGRGPGLFQLRISLRFLHRPHPPPVMSSSRVTGHLHDGGCVSDDDGGGQAKHWNAISPMGTRVPFSCATSHVHGSSARCGGNPRRWVYGRRASATASGLGRVTRAMAAEAVSIASADRPRTANAMGAISP